MKLAENPRHQVAKTIFEQLGGNRFVAMTAASEFVYQPNKLTFKLPNRMAKNGATVVKVELRGDDTYTIEFMRFYRLNLRLISKHTNVYFDQLQEVFTRETGLYTSL